MKDENRSNLPSQKELEKEISDYLSRKYGERVKIVTTGFVPKAETDGGEKNVPRAEEGYDFHFDLKPEDLISYLDDYVVQQDEAKAVLATKICTHFNRIHYLQDKDKAEKRRIGQIKNNVLLIGPTGVGKTFLIKLIARKIGVPFIKGDATKFSETGYVGGDVEDLIRDLVREVDGDIERAQYGIVYLDEVDKIARSDNRLGADVSRSGVQRALLKPMEETDVDLKVPHDMISQIEAMEHYRATGKRERKTVNTKNILFIMSGAFDGLEEIVRKRVQKSSIGFEGTIASKTGSGKLLPRVKAEDLVNFGFESEFIGRLPIIAVLNQLTVEDFYQILLNPNSPVIVAKKQDFLAYGIHLAFDDEALKEISKLAVQEKTGARGLVSVVEKILLPFEKMLPSSQVRHLAVNPEIVKNPLQELDLLLHDSKIQSRHTNEYNRFRSEEYDRLIAFFKEKRSIYLQTHGVNPTEEKIVLMAEQCFREDCDPIDACDEMIQLVRHIRDWEEIISEQCGVHVIFDEEAIDRILVEPDRTFDSIDRLCENLAKAFEYGLRLMSQKRHTESVNIPSRAIEAPEEFINELVERTFKL